MIKQNPALRGFWKKRARNRVLYGGRDSSKSWDAAIEAVKLSNHYNLKFLCTRQFQNRIEDSVYTLLINIISKTGLSSRFTILKNKIVNNHTGSEFVFYGLWRHIEEIKSLEGVDVCWIEEAASLNKNQWKILEPTIRKQGSQFWIIFNPKLSSDFVYQNFVINPPPNTVMQKINYDENKHISETSLSIIKYLYKTDPDSAAHIYGGEPMDDDDSVIIKRSWIEAAVDAHIKTNMDFTGSKTVGYDVADSGDDKNAMTHIDGSLCDYIDEWRGGENELSKSCKRVYRLAVKDDSHIVYDSIGVGASTGSMLNEMFYSKHSKFIAGAKVVKPKQKYEGVKNKEFFSNLKAQSWWLVADRFRATYNCVVKGVETHPDNMISISSDCSNLERLMLELSTVKKDFDKTGKVKVESKEDLLKRDILSPNLADSFIMAASKGLVFAGGLNAVKIKGF